MTVLVNKLLILYLTIHYLNTGQKYLFVPPLFFIHAISYSSRNRARIIRRGVLIEVCALTEGVRYINHSFTQPLICRRWVHRHLSRPVEMRYNPHTQTIEAIDSMQGLENLVTQLKIEMLHFNNVVTKVNQQHTKR